MRVGKSLSGLLVLGAVVAVPAMADEVVYFTNGTYLVVTSHELQKSMVAVQLGSNSRMGFPLYMVDKIESAGRNVYLNPTYHPTNQAVAAADGSGKQGGSAPHPVTGAGSVPSRFITARPTPATGVPGQEAKQFEAMWAGGAPAGAVAVPVAGRREPPGLDEADRSLAELRALQSGIPLPQPPQSLQGGQSRRSNLVRVMPRANPIGSGGGGPSGPPATPPPVVDPTQPADQTPPDTSQQNPPSGS